MWFLTFHFAKSKYILSNLQLSCKLPFLSWMRMMQIALVISQADWPLHLCDQIKQPRTSWAEIENQATEGTQSCAVATEQWTESRTAGGHGTAHCTGDSNGTSAFILQLIPSDFDWYNHWLIDQLKSWTHCYCVTQLTDLFIGQLGFTLNFCPHALYINYHSVNGCIILHNWISTDF